MRSEHEGSQENSKILSRKLAAGQRRRRQEEVTDAFKESQRKGRRGKSGATH